MARSYTGDLRTAKVIVGLVILCCALRSEQSLSERIVAAQGSGNYAEAGRLYLALIASGTDTPEIRSNCGIMLHLAGNNRQALEQFRVALRRDPDLPAANLFAGLAEFDLGETDAALPFLKKAQRLDPARPAPLLALGKAYVAAREYQNAIECYAKAVEMNSKLAEAWYGLGVTDRSLAEQTLNHAARKGQSGSTATRIEVQRLLDGAVKALTRAVDLDPDSARTHLLMAESLSDSGKLAEAVPEYRTAMKLDSGMEAAYLGLASAYWKQREFDQAVPLLKHVLSKSPKDPDANAMMADVLEHNGDIRNAELCAETALKGNPDLIQTRVVLARIYLARKQPKLAIDELHKVIAADTDGSYHFLLYRACRAAGDEHGAKEAMSEFQRMRYSSAN